MAGVLEHPFFQVGSMAVAEQSDREQEMIAQFAQTLQRIETNTIDLKRGQRRLSQQMRGQMAALMQTIVDSRLPGQRLSPSRSVRPVIVTWAPCAASSTATPLPTPRVAPVTIAFMPSRESIREH